MNPSLERLELEIEAAPGPLLPQVRRALADRLAPEEEPLRWAITAVEPPSTGTGLARLALEAVILRMPR
ncbi:MAG: hypothetical protein ACK5QW_11345 [Cyanobacteriota bacterium]|jgi:hypothetical protein